MTKMVKVRKLLQMEMLNWEIAVLEEGPGSVFKYLRDHHVEGGLALFCIVPNDRTRINS